MPRANVSPGPRAGRQPIDAADLPVIGSRRQTLLAGLVVTIGGIWIAVPLLALVTGARPPLPDLGVAGSCVLLTAGIGQVLWGLDLLLRRETLIIDQGMLHVSVRGLLSARRWSEPLANYHGLRHRRQRVRHRYGWRLMHRLQLAHPNPAKEIELARTWRERRIETARRQWADLLKLPLWSADGGAPPRRSPGSDRRTVPAKGLPTY